MKKRIIGHFKEFLGIEWEPDDMQANALDRLISYAESKGQQV